MANDGKDERTERTKQKKLVQTANNALMLFFPLFGRSFGLLVGNYCVQCNESCADNRMMIQFDDNGK